MRPADIAPAACAAALLATVLVAPDAPWRVPLAVLGGVWAPGWGLVALVWPARDARLSALERHALAFGLGLVIAPVAALVVGTRPGALAGAATLLAAVGLVRERGPPHARPIALGSDRAHGPAPASWSTPPSTRATLAIAVAALLAAAALWAAPLLAPDPTPGVALALTGPDGSAATLPRSAVVGEPVRVAVEVHARAAESGRLVVVAGATTLFDEDVFAPARFELAVPTLEPGRMSLKAAWSGATTREVHAWLVVEEAPG
ncbi:MAG TPA: DUF1616 domain-containing protein [Candidatus Thermoplasmatota archaeon]|nr:DUF1616 domain-containing protein [Candidatus Thermoplasmatota archaeon]